MQKVVTLNTRCDVAFIIAMYVHHLSLYCILFRRFLITKINVALQLTKLWLKKVTTTTDIPVATHHNRFFSEPPMTTDDNPQLALFRAFKSLQHLKDHNKPSVRWKSFAFYELVRRHFHIGWASGLLFVFFRDSVNNQKYVWIILLKMDFFGFPKVVVVWPSMQDHCCPMHGISYCQAAKIHKACCSYSSFQLHICQQSATAIQPDILLLLTDLQRHGIGISYGREPWARAQF